MKRLKVELVRTATLRSCALGLAVVGFVFASSGGTLRVVPDAASKSYPGWENASTDIKSTIEGAAQNDVVEVMNGHYDIAAQISVSSADVTIKSINPTTGETDFGGAVFDARRDDPNREIRILKTAQDTRIRGCTFVNAHVSSGDDDCGGAILITNYKCAYVNDCAFSNNYVASWGAAVGGKEAPTLVASNVLFVCNEAAYEGSTRSVGGAYGALTGGSSQFVDCVFRQNVSTTKPGAAVGISSGSVSLRNCTFDGNEGSSVVRCRETGLAVGCVFKNHSSVSSGICDNFNVSNCVFTANSCSTMFVGASDMPACWNTAITNNTVKYLLCNNHAMRFYNCLVAANDFGSGTMFHRHTTSYHSRVMLYNTTVVNNTGGKIWQPGGSSDARDGLAVTNCIFWGNTFTSASTPGSAPVVGGYNCSDDAFIQGLTDSRTRWTADPQLVSSGFAKAYRLKDVSPYLESGAAFDWMQGAVDLAGDPRILDGSGEPKPGALPALGCYERPADWFAVAKKVVPDEGSKSVPGWEDATTDLKAAVEGAASGDVIYLMNGHYDVPSAITVPVNNVTIRSLNPATLTTDFGGAILDARKGDDARETRILSARENTRIYGCQFVNAHLSSENYSTDCGAAVYLLDGYKKVYINDCVFSNNYTRCYGAAIGCNWGAYGGAIVSNTYFVCNEAVNVKSGTYPAGGAFGLFHGQNSELTDCVFSRNSVGDDALGAAVGVGNGGNIYMVRCSFLENAGKTIVYGAGYGAGAGMARDCLFKGNTPASCVSQGAFTVSNCVFTANSSSTGGLIGGSSGRPVCWNSVFTNNTTGGFVSNSHAMQFRNCLVSDNTFSSSFLRTNKQWPTVNTFENCTIANNSAHELWWDWQNAAGFGLAMTNTIVWGNSFASATSVSDAFFKDGDNMCTDDLFVKSFADAGTLLTSNPRFNDASARDYRLQGRSPCVDKGVRLDWMSLGAFDVAGCPRTVDRSTGRASSTALVDIGCYECQEKAFGFLLLFK